MQKDNSTKKRYESVEQPDSCPACGSNRVARILYGKPSHRPQLMEKVREGKIVFGGCIIDRDNPSWKCLACATNIHWKH